VLCVRTIAVGLAFTGAAFCQNGIFVNCSRGASLQFAVAHAGPGTTITAGGACKGPVTVAKDGLKIHNGASRTELNGFTITGGNNGVVPENSSQITLQGTTATRNALRGLALLGNPSATIDQFSSTNNALFGIDVEATSSLIVTRTDTVQGNGSSAFR